MTRKNIFILAFLLAMAGCKGCLSNLYKVHAEVEYLHIHFVDSSLSSEQVLLFIDSTMSGNHESYNISDTMDGVLLKEEDRIVLFKTFPEESYWVSCNSSPCWIKGVFNKNIDSLNWIYDTTKVGGRQLHRIRIRFSNEVLDKVHRDK